MNNLNSEYADTLFPSYAREIVMRYSEIPAKEVNVKDCVIIDNHLICINLIHTASEGYCIFYSKDIFGGTSQQGICGGSEILKVARLNVMGG
jgi:hypothetical protein